MNYQTISNVPTINNTSTINMSCGSTGGLVVSNTTGGVAYPALYVINPTGVTGATAAPSIRFDKPTSNGAVGDTISFISSWGNDAGGTTKEWTRISSQTQNIGASPSSNQDGRLSISCLRNNAMVDYFYFNGADDENNCLRPLDMNGQSIKTTSGNLAIETTSSTGIGTLTLNAKESVNINAGVGKSCVFSTQLTLPTASGTVSFTGNTLTCDFSSLSTGIFNIQIGANMTAVTFLSGRAGGQYVIYITNSSGTTITISIIKTG